MPPCNRLSENGDTPGSPVSPLWPANVSENHDFPVLFEALSLESCFKIIYNLVLSLGCLLYVIRVLASMETSAPVVINP